MGRVYSLGDTDAAEVLAEGVGLDGQDTLVVEEAGRAPEAGLDAVNETRVGGQAQGLGDTPRVAQDDVLALAVVGPAEDGVCVVGDQVGAAVHVARGVGEGGHGADGLEVDAVVADDTEDVLSLVLLGEEVVGLTAVDLGHGLDRVTVGGLGNVGALVLGLGDPLGKGLLVQGGPDVVLAGSAAVDGVVAGLVDRDLIVDLDGAGLGVVAVSALVVELDLEAAAVVHVLILHVAAVALVATVGLAGGTLDLGWVGPEDGEDGSNEPRVAGGSLDGVVKAADVVAVAVGLEHVVVVAQAEAVDISNQAHGSVLEDDLVNVAPCAVGRSPLALLLLAAEAGGELAHAASDLLVGDSAGNVLSLENNAELAILDAGLLDSGLVELVETQLLKVTELLDARHVRSDEIMLGEDLHVVLLELLSVALLLVELETSKEDRAVLHVKELIVVGLQDIREDARDVHCTVCSQYPVHWMIRRRTTHCCGGQACGQAWPQPWRRG